MAKFTVTAAEDWVAVEIAVEALAALYVSVTASVPAVALNNRLLYPDAPWMAVTTAATFVGAVVNVCDIEFVPSETVNFCPAKSASPVAVSPVND